MTARHLTLIKRMESPGSADTNAKALGPAQETCLFWMRAHAIDRTGNACHDRTPFESESSRLLRGLAEGAAPNRPGAGQNVYGASQGVHAGFSL